MTDSRNDYNSMYQQHYRERSSIDIEYDKVSRNDVAVARCIAMRKDGQFEDDCEMLRAAVVLLAREKEGLKEHLLQEKHKRIGRLFD